MQKFLSSLLFTLVLIATIGAPSPVHAQAGNLQIIPDSWTAPPCNIVDGRMKAECIPKLIGHLVGVVFSVISAFFLINVMVAGYQIAMGSWTGDKANGKDRLTWSIIGLVISVCSFLILDLVVSIITP
jgi:hypothetical protein